MAFKKKFEIHKAKEQKVEKENVSRTTKLDSRNSAIEMSGLCDPSKSVSIVGSKLSVECCRLLVLETLGREDFMGVGMGRVTTLNFRDYQS